jgi:hypothetical protein
MFHTDKLHINKPLCFATLFLIGALFSVPSMAQSDDGKITPLQLRTIQTRKFSKPIDEIIEAVKTGGEDAGYRCFLNLIPSVGSDGKVDRSRAQGQCVLNPKASGQGAAMGAAFIPIFGGLISAGLQAQANSEYLEQMHTIKYEMKGDKDAGVVLRMRAYNVKQDQITNPEVYSKQFKMLGDALFIQAIEINPAEQE